MTAIVFMLDLGRLVGTAGRQPLLVRLQDTTVDVDQELSAHQAGLALDRSSVFVSMIDCQLNVAYAIRLDGQPNVRKESIFTTAS
jgi:hypothetical protein